VNKTPMTDKYFRKAMATSIVCIVVCMMCLASLTWAWYSASVQSSNNTLVAASFVTKTEVFNVTDPNNKHEVDISNPLPAGKYEVTVTQLGTSKTGYCIVAINQSDFYAGSFIPNTEGDPSVSFTFTVKNAIISGNEEQRQLPIEIIPVWGIYSQNRLENFPSEIVGTQTLNSTSKVSLDADETKTAQESETTASEAETTAPETTVETEDTTSDITTSDTTTSEPESTDSESTATDTDAAASDEEGAEADTTETTGPEESTASPKEDATIPEEENDETADSVEETTTATETLQEQITE